MSSQYEDSEHIKYLEQKIIDLKNKLKNLKNDPNTRQTLIDNTTIILQSFQEKLDSIKTKR